MVGIFGLLAWALIPFLSPPQGKHKVVKARLALKPAGLLPEMANLIWKEKQPSCVISKNSASLVGNECGRLTALLTRLYGLTRGEEQNDWLVRNFAERYFSWENHNRVRQALHLGHPGGLAPARTFWENPAESGSWDWLYFLNCECAPKPTSRFVSREWKVSWLDQCRHRDDLKEAMKKK